MQILFHIDGKDKQNQTGVAQPIKVLTAYPFLSCVHLPHLSGYSISHRYRLQLYTRPEFLWRKPNKH